MARQEAIRRPARWERLLAATLWLIIAVTHIVLPGWLPIVALALVIVPFLVLRARRPFVARHSLLAACWWGFLLLYVFVVILAAALCGVPQPTLSGLLTQALPRIISSPNLFPVFWQYFDRSVQIVVIALAVGVGVSVLVSLVGIGAALLGWPAPRAVKPAKQPRRKAAPA